MNSLKARRTFSGASTWPGVTSPLPLDALRTCNLFLPELAQGEEDFLWCLNLPRGYISSSLGCTEDLQSVLAWTHSRVRRTFSGASTCPRVTSPLPLDALRTCNLFLPKLAQGEEDFLWCLNLPMGYISSSPGCTKDFQSVLSWTYSRVRRTFSGASTCPGVHLLFPWMHWGLSNLPRFAYAKRSCNLFSPTLARGEECWTKWCSMFWRIQILWRMMKPLLCLMLLCWFKLCYGIV